MTMPADNAARLAALTDFDRTLLVEAGAGSGKTAIMAGRVAMMLLDGIEPRHIVAITFTEAAAGELLTRIRDFLTKLAEGEVPMELAVALPGGLNEEQRTNLDLAAQHVDELTCGTIHSFCQQLIRPYPVEAGTDPGASIMDPVEVELQLNEVTDDWLSRRLAGDEGGFLPELVWNDPNQALKLVRTIIKEQHKSRGLQPPPAAGAAEEIKVFRAAALSFQQHVAGAQVQVPEVLAIANELAGAAKGMALDPDLPEAEQFVNMLSLDLSSSVLVQAGTFRKFRHKGRFQAQAAVMGLSKAAGDAANHAATNYYDHCGEAWEAVRCAIASVVLSGIMQETAPIMDSFRDSKRATAQLDFDDLLHTARELLRNSEAVRAALADRFRHVLVDEFQDTDPLQAEILWRLCGESTHPAGAGRDRSIRPGALFLVGDPKQAIYRFRGADVQTYLQARQSIADHDPAAILSISTNFRSQPGILDFANEVFQDHLSRKGQPGFTPLNAFLINQPGLPQVSHLKVSLGDIEKPTVHDCRVAEARDVADLCARLIGSHQVRDRVSDEMRPCRPGDIALLAPVGSSLDLYENELEDRGIPIATQAGKGLYRRQEIQDMIALTRLLADSRDTLAFGAFLRGPLVGLTDEQLLDIVEQQPSPEEHPHSLPRLDLQLDPAYILDPYAREVIEKLQSLYRRVNSTTPHDLLSQAVDLLNIRALLSNRHRRRAERALANLDTYLELLQNYSVRGLRAAAQVMTDAWQDEAGAVEGRTDAAEDAVSIVTMHSAKGLEWPIVIPVNAMGQPQSTSGEFSDRAAGILYCPVFKIKPTGYQAAADREDLELNRERTRLWYVALTRARDTLVIPNTAVGSKTASWADTVDLLAHAELLPELDASHWPLAFDLYRNEQGNTQTREVFREQAEQIAAHKREVTWAAPSRDEQTGPLTNDLDSDFRLMGDEDDPLFTEVAPPTQGGRERGLVLHKLVEEVLTGELTEDGLAIQSRAAQLIAELGRDAVEDAATGLSVSELAECVVRTFALPEIAELRDRLVPEFPIGYSSVTDGAEQIVAGISDAVAYDLDGSPLAVVDWKSDVNPAPATVDHYAAQIRTYMQATGAERGLIVFMTSGKCLEIAPNMTSNSGAYSYSIRNGA